MSTGTLGHVRRKVLPMLDDFAGLGLACEKNFTQMLYYNRQSPQQSAFHDTFEYHYVDTESFLISKPGTFRLQVPDWAQTCILSLTGSGGGGSGASVNGYLVRAGSGGGAAAAVVAMPIDLSTPDNKKLAREFIVEISDGGLGGDFAQPGQPGSESRVLLGGTVLITAEGGSGAAVEQPGMGGKSFKCALNGNDGLPGGTTVGSQGSPIGGSGGNSFFSYGGSGGTPSSATSADGSSGKIGGSGGGGGSPWGANGKGGNGGSGFAQIQWIR